MVREVVVATFLMLSGCTGGGKGGDPADQADGVPTDSGAETLTAQSAVGAPTWEVGQWWEWETTFGTDVADYLFCSIVLTAGPTPHLVTEFEDSAKGDAAFDHPLLGTIGPGLAMTGWGAEGWSLLSFPLTDGKTWTSTMPNIAWDIVEDFTVDLDMSSTFHANIGEGGGFRIMGHYGNDMLVDAEYDPGVGWFTGLRFFDVDPGQEGLEVGFRANSVGLNYTGPYFQFTGETLAQVGEGIGFDDVPTEGGQPFADPEPRTTFAMEAGTILYGYIAVQAGVGHKQAVLIDPNNGQRRVQADGDLDGEEEIIFLDDPSISGEWQLLAVGAGGYTWMEAYLSELTGGEGAFV